MIASDSSRTQKMRTAVGYLIEIGNYKQGNQSRLADHFKVSRQRVRQIFFEELGKRGLPSRCPILRSNPYKVRANQVFLYLRGDQLRNLRLSFRLSQECFGYILGIDQTTVSNYETAKVRRIQQERVERWVASATKKDPEIARQLEKLFSHEVPAEAALGSLAGK